MNAFEYFHISSMLRNLYEITENLEIRSLLIGISLIVRSQSWHVHNSIVPARLKYPHPVSTFIEALSCC